jgi:hypothetical protein
MTTRDTIGCVTVALDRTLGTKPLAKYDVVEETVKLFPEIRKSGNQIVDAWSNPLDIEIRAFDKVIDVSITSAGPDGRFGTSDDLMKAVWLEMKPGGSEGDRRD